MSLRTGLRTEHSGPSRAALAVVRLPRDYGANKNTQFDTW
jgi:hypothetical protein